MINSAAIAKSKCHSSTDDSLNNGSLAQLVKSNPENINYRNNTNDIAYYCVTENGSNHVLYNKLVHTMAEWLH